MSENDSLAALSRAINWFASQVSHDEKEIEQATNLIADTRRKLAEAEAWQESATIRRDVHQREYERLVDKYDRLATGKQP